MDELAVPPGARPERLDTFLTRALPGASRQRVRALIANDAVRVNGRWRPKGSLVQPGDIVRVQAPLAPPTASPAPNSSLDITVLHEDDDVVVVDKPAGLPSHALRAGETGTVANFLLAHYPELGGVGEDRREAGLVHRLDTGTSGVLIAARTSAAYAALRQQFRAHSVLKEYVALVEGDVARGGEIRAPIAHDRRRRGRMRVCSNDAEATARRARPAVTRYRPLARFAHDTLLAVEIPTGVMHQIRVHLASIGHAIVGDAQYGRGGAQRPLLHAQRITFNHPSRAMRLSVESPIPADLQREIRLRRKRSPEASRSGPGKRRDGRVRRS